MSQKKSNNKKNASMKVRAPGSKISLAKAKYEIANEFGLSIANNKQLNECGPTKSKLNSKTKSRRQNNTKNCK